jgi:hypothetical protein
LLNAVVGLQAFVATGTNIQLVFNPSTNGYSTADHGRECDFDKEHGKVSRVEIDEPRMRNERSCYRWTCNHHSSHTVVSSRQAHIPQSVSVSPEFITVYMGAEHGAFHPAAILT